MPNNVVAQSAIDGLNDKEYRGQKLKVNATRTRNEKGGNRGGLVSADGMKGTTGEGVFDNPESRSSQTSLDSPDGMDASPERIIIGYRYRKEEDHG